MGGDLNGFGSGFGYSTSGGGGPSYQFYPDGGGPFRGGRGIPRGRGRGRGRFPRGKTYHLANDYCCVVYSACSS